MRDRVIVVGGGIGGLTAAHELIERGFDVHVYERRAYFGGKAASRRVQVSDGSGLPTEHGFRFFPGWYRHLPDTLKRIPFRGERAEYEGATVYDNLVDIEAGLLAWFNRESVRAPMHVPRTLGQATTALAFLERVQDLGLEPGEIASFAQKLAQFALMDDAEREARLEPITWWQYLESDTKSTAYRDLISSTTRSMVAAKATEASAYSMGRLALRTMFDAFSTVDRVLNGPTNEVWIEPWVRYLTGRGVRFHTGRELERIEFKANEKAVGAVHFSRAEAAEHRKLAQLIARLAEAVAKLKAPELHTDLDRRTRDGVFAQLETDLRSLETLTTLSEHARDVWSQLDAPSARELLGDEARIAKLQPLADAEAQRAHPAVDAPTTERVEAEYFVFALPVEQMAYYVNRSSMLKHYDPSLRRILDLAGHTDWMSGIQFYLQEPADIARGHIVFMDSEWSLTAIEQTQFWRDTRDVPSDVRSILSVDIATWDRKGHYLQKEAFDCTRDEIAKEVWSQIQGSLNRGGQRRKLRPEMLRGGPQLQALDHHGAGNYHLDENVVDLLDRKKQAAYEKARGVRADRPQAVAPWSDPGDAPYVWGGRTLYNAEPLLVNRSGSRALRPSAVTAITNFFLAADYVATETDLACMEGANEAARAAVNGILEASGSRAERCKLWRLSVTDQATDWLSDTRWIAGGLDTALGATRSLGKLAGGFMNAASRIARNNLNRGKPR